MPSISHERVVPIVTSYWFRGPSLHQLASTQDTVSKPNQLASGVRTMLVRLGGEWFPRLDDGCVESTSTYPNNRST